MFFCFDSHVPGVEKGRSLYFFFTKAERKTPGGHVAQLLSTSTFKTEQFKGVFAENLRGTSPIEAILCLDTFQSMYTHMLCGLIMRHDVTRIGAGFASGLLRAIRFLQLNWQELALDIAAGTLSPRVTDPAIRARVAEILSPDPALAEFISAECRDENWEGIITRIWPNTKCLEAVITGAMAQYVPMLDYYSNGLPNVSCLYASSECCFGMNLKPMCDPYEVSYTIMPNMAYFEFIPHSGREDSEDSATQLIELADLEIGKDYEIIVTNYAGLWRYRVGDILRVTGFHNKAPQFRFVRRKNVLLSIDLDMTDEAELHGAIQNASALLKEFDTSVLEYTSYADTKAIPGHYVIYWELLVRDPMRPPSHELLAKCCLAVEESLSSVYRQYRAAERTIGPLEIRVVKNGTFEELMDYAISRGASISQYKVPRCVNSEPIVQLLDARVVSAHFSPAAPHWSP